MKMHHLFTALATGALASLASPAISADKELIIFDWAGYEDPEFFKGYTEKHGESPTFAFFGDEEEAFQKMRAGFRADVSHPCSQSVPKWIEAGIIEPIDTSRIDAWYDLIPEFRDMDEFYADGKAYFVPMDWGNTMLTYNPDLVPVEDVQSLQVFKDPKYAGAISLPDNVDDAFALAFLATGVKDWSTATEEQFQAAADWMREVHPNVVTYWADGASLSQLMTSGEVKISWAWNETFVTMGWEELPIAVNRDTKEGYSTWICGYAKVADGPGSDDQFYDFINAWLEKRTADYLVTQWGYGHSNAKAMATIDEATLEASALTTSDELRANTLWQGPAPTWLREKMIAEFEMIKSGF